MYVCHLCISLNQKKPDKMLWEEDKTFIDCIQEWKNTFGRRVPQFWRKLFWCFSTWKKWDLALWNIFWSSGCVKNAKNVKIVKKLIFMIFWHKTPFTINNRMAKNKFKIFFHFREKWTLQKLKLLKNPSFYFFEI